MKIFKTDVNSNEIFDLTKENYTSQTKVFFNCNIEKAPYFYVIEGFRKESVSFFKT